MGVSDFDKFFDQIFKEVRSINKLSLILFSTRFYRVVTTS